MITDIQLWWRDIDGIYYYLTTDSEPLHICMSVDLPFDPNRFKDYIQNCLGFVNHQIQMEIIDLIPRLLILEAFQ
jgi:hypothetical protein